MGSMGRVLVVDDDPAVCALIHDILQEVRLKAVCITDDREAYRVIPTLPTIQALVVDVNLGPGSTGFDIARFARQVIPDLPVIYVTGQSTRDSFQAFGVPGSDYLQKPFSVDDLLATLLVRLKRPGAKARAERRRA
jgi:DNA-binding response OmpR family regulator